VSRALNCVLVAIVLVGAIAMARAQGTNPCGPQPLGTWDAPRMTTPDSSGRQQRCILIDGVLQCY
jgi:hypothetical protein